MRCEPANSLIEKLGGLTVVARATDKSVTTVMRWRMPKKKGGTGGTVPHWHIPHLRDLAREQGVPLTDADFLPKERARAA